MHLLKISQHQRNTQFGRISQSLFNLCHVHFPKVAKSKGFRKWRSQKTIKSKHTRPEKPDWKHKTTKRFLDGIYLAFSNLNKVIICGTNKGFFFFFSCLEDDKCVRQSRAHFLSEISVKSKMSTFIHHTSSVDTNPLSCEILFICQ